MSHPPPPPSFPPPPPMGSMPLPPMQHGVMMPPINVPSHPGMMMSLAGGPIYPPPPPGVPPPGAVPVPIRPPMPPPPLPVGGVGGAGMMPPLTIPPGVNNIMRGETIMGTGADSSIAVQKNNLHLNYHPQNSAQTVVLTHLPAFLRGVRILRDASYPCGSARTVHVGCCAPNSEEEGRKMMERGLLPSALVAAATTTIGASGGSGGGNANELEKEAMKLLSWKGANGGVAVVKMGHFTGAQNFAGGMLALVRCKGETLPPKPGPDGSVGEKCVETNNGVEDDKVKDENAAGEDVANPPVDKSTNHDGDNKKQSPEYNKDEEAKHLETLRQLKNMRVYHLFNHHIPDPIPPDMNIPQSAPVPQDPAVPYHLLEALTTLRLRYEESVKEAAELAKSGKDPLSTSVSYIHDDEWGGHAAAAAGEEDHDKSNVGDGIGGFKLDKAKIAAAAGGVAGYDEEADPLNAPEVIKAVLAFKRQLEQQNVKGKKRRIEIVSERMEKKVKEMLERGRKEVKEMKLLQERQKQEQEQEQEREPVIPSSERKDVEDTGRRGVSNLPAWMTKGETSNGETGASTAIDQKADASPTKVVGIDDGDDGKKRKFVPSEANRDINMRKQKLDVVEGSMSLSEIRAANEAADKAAVVAASTAATPFVIQTTKEGILSSGSQFPPLSSEAVDTLKQYVTAQIIDYLGEEESTLIEFIVKELRKESGCTTLSLLEEMKVVLDEDAEEFVLGLYRKMVE